MSETMAILAERVNERVFCPQDSPAFDEAKRALNRIEKRHGLSRSESHALREALAYEVMFPPAAPDKAPELWSERKGTKDNPVTFIRRVYAPWLGRGLRRSHLLSLDRALYTSLSVWLHRHPETGFPELDK
jgi:hypothetical protein